MNHKTYVSSDFAFNNPKKMDEWEKYGDAIVPVDLNWASVPKSKNASDNFTNMQTSLRRRFSLGDDE